MHDAKVNVKVFVYGLGKALGDSGQIEASGISRHSVHEGGKVDSPEHRPPLPSIRHLWYSFLLGAESTEVP